MRRKMDATPRQLPRVRRTRGGPARVTIGPRLHQPAGRRSPSAPRAEGWLQPRTSPATTMGAGPTLATQTGLRKSMIATAIALICWRRRGTEVIRSPSTSGSLLKRSPATFGTQFWPIPTRRGAIFAAGRSRRWRPPTSWSTQPSPATVRSLTVWRTATCRNNV